MSTQNINGYEIERFSIGDDDYFDMDWLDGAVYKTAKVKGSIIKALASGLNIYNSNGTLTGDRIVDGDLNSLTFDNLRRLFININTAPLGATGLEMNIEPSGSLIRVRDAGTTDIRFEITQTGNLRLNDAFEFPLVDGNAGQILQTDGSGNLTWIDLPTGNMNSSVYDPNLDGVVLSAQKLMLECINKTGALVPKGTIVYLKTTSSSGTHPEIVLASNIDEPSSSKTIGATFQDIPNDAIGFIVTNGEVDNLNTSAYSIGTRLWLGTTAGSITTTPPVAPLHAVFIGIVTRSQTINGRVLYSIQNGFELNELHNVLITSPLDGQTLQFDATSQLWKNVSQSSPTQTDLDPVINVLNTPPVSPNVGDRYRIGTSPNGIWVGQNNNIAEWNGTSWIFTTPVVDNIVFQTATATTFRFNGTSWLQWAGTPILQNGNTIGGIVRIGTNDNFNVIVKTNNVDRFIHGSTSFSQKGSAGFYGTFNFSGVTLAQNYNLPNQSGTIALVSDIPSQSFIPSLNANEIRRGVIAISGSINQGTYGALSPINTGSIVLVNMNISDTTPFPKFRMLTTAGSTNSVVGISFGNSSIVHRIGFGFRFIGVYSITDRSSGGIEWFVPNARHFCGMASVGTILGISSTITLQSQLNIIGIGSDATDVNLQLFHNDGTGTATKIDLGSSFPANKSGAVTNFESYRLELFNEFQSQEVKYRVTKLSNGTQTTGTIQNDLPSGFIAPQIVRTSGSTSQNVSLDIESITAYTEN
jgi:hypothetical protein